MKLVWKLRVNDHHNPPIDHTFTDLQEAVDFVARREVSDPPITLKEEIRDAFEDIAEYEGCDSYILLPGVEST